MSVPPQNRKREPKIPKLVFALLDWYVQSARDLPWRRTRDPYAIWVSEIMLQQTQVKTVLPYWERWMRELPTIQVAANAPADKIHKLWEGLGYYARVRNLQKAARQIIAQHAVISKPRRRRGNESQTKKELETPHVVPYKFPDNFDDVLALPGIGRYTAGAICSIAFNQPTPILDGNVIRVLTRVFGIGENPREKKTNAQLWQLAEELVVQASRLAAPQRSEDGIMRHASRPSSRSSRLRYTSSRRRTRDESEDDSAVSHINQSLMELGALVCTPRNPQCPVCPVKKLCVAFHENRVGKLPNLGKRTKATVRRFVAFVIERNGKFLVRQRPAGVVNAHLWEFPNAEADGTDAKAVFKSIFGIAPAVLQPLCTVKHSITRYRITLEAFRVHLGGRSSTMPKKFVAGRTRLSENNDVWLPPAKLGFLAFTAAHRRIFRCLPARSQ